MAGETHGCECGSGNGRERRAVIYLAAGCFWGVEEIYAKMPGVSGTAVGFMGGHTENPTYPQVCTGTTGHAETVKVVFDPQRTDTAKILQTFFECHDPTSLNRQGGDIGTQYRSAIFHTTEEQKNTAKNMIAAYGKVLSAHGKGRIVTQLHDAAHFPFYPAEEKHQRYLEKNPDGYRCHSASGIACPLPGAGPVHLN